MRHKDNFANWQDRMFQEIRDLESLEAQKEAELRQETRDLAHIAKEYFGLNEEEILALYRPGMNGAQFLDAMKAASKK